MFNVFCLLIVRDLKTMKIEACQNCSRNVPAEHPEGALQAVYDDLYNSYAALGAPPSFKRQGSVTARLDGKEYEYFMFNVQEV